jgi:hypothetical protein
MYEIKVTPDSGSRFIVKVSRDELEGMMKELSKRMGAGLVNFITVKPIWEVSE